MTFVMGVEAGDPLIDGSAAGTDHDVMLTEPTTATLPKAPDEGALMVIRALLLVQIGVIVTASVESLVVGVASPNMVGLPLLNGVFAIWTMFLMRGIGNRGPRARLWTIRLQIGWIGLAVIDLLLAAFLADRGLEPVPVLTRLLVPTLLIHLLRRPTVRALFEVSS